MSINKFHHCTPTNMIKFLMRITECVEIFSFIIFSKLLNFKQMKNCRVVLTLVVFLAFVSVKAQLNSGTVMGLPTGTMAEITAITGAQEGAIAYATDTNKIYRFDGANWEEIGSNSSSSTYTGTFIITATGLQPITGIPFQPSQISFVAHANVEQVMLNSDDGINNNSNVIEKSFGTGTGFARDNDASIIQRAAFIGGSGRSINNISRYASSSHCIGIRYANQNGDVANGFGYTTASLSSFNLDGFTLNVDSYIDNLLVIYEAYK